MKRTIKTLCGGVAIALSATSFGQGPNQVYGWQVRLLQIGQSYKLHQYASEGFTPLTDWATYPSDWHWGSAAFGDHLSDGLNQEDDINVAYALAVTLSGGVKPQFRWIAGPNNMPAPRYVYVRNAASATRSSMGQTPQGTVNNGLGSPTSWSSHGFRQAGSRVYKLEGTGLIEMPTNMLFVDSYLSSVDGTPMGNVAFSSQVLPYPYISGNEVFHEDSGNFGKGPNGERVRNLWNAEKLIRVDAVLEWRDATYNHPAGWYAEPVLEAKQSIYDSNRVYWTHHLHGDCVERGVYFSSGGDWGTIRPLMYYDATTGQASNQFSLFIAHVVDRENENNPEIDIPFEVRWHYPFENWTRFSPDVQRYFPTLTRNPQPSPDGCGPGDSFQWDSFDQNARWIDYVNWVPDWAGTGADFVSIPIVAGLVSFVGLATEQIIEQEMQGHSAAFEIHWGRETSKYLPTYNPLMKESYKMTAVYMVGKTEHFLEADDYRGNNGYQGPIRKVLNRRDGRTDVWATFTLDGGDPPVGPQV
ncbi:MAG: hypothetical protein KF784_05580 [Fimbriimonadaceae bacterium]|nr:hypothetical protein [Fimbriimonadaceae bacterium]